jgi:hypothetical protein
LRSLPATVLLCALLAPLGRAHAQEEQRTAFEAGLRVGVAFPFGDSSAGKALSDLVGPSFPFTFELGVRLFGRYELAVVGQYALGSVNTTTSAGCYTGSNACSASSGQLGLEFVYHPLGLEAIDPFVGVGAGYEWLPIRATVQGRNYDLSLGGWNWVQVQAGVEFALGRLIRVGPFTALSVGQYDTVSYTVPTASGPLSGSGPVANPAVHLWLSIGLRAVVLP